MQLIANVCVCLQVEGKKGQIGNLETQIDELKKRSSNQLDEINRLEDQCRNMTIEQTSMQSKIDQLQSNVSINIRAKLAPVKVMPSNFKIYSKQ